LILPALAFQKSNLQERFQQPSCSMLEWPSDIMKKSENGFSGWLTICRALVMVMIDENSYEYDRSSGR